jgi:Na+/melibiose symporter-like transporter
MMSCQTMFNAGWAIVQISHLSMIPSLAKTEDDKIDLNAIRQANVYMSSILVYLLAGIYIKNGTDGFQWADRISLMYLCYTAIGVGLIGSIMFQFLTPEQATETSIFESTCDVETSTNKARTMK